MPAAAPLRRRLSVGVGGRAPCAALREGCPVDRSVVSFEPAVPSTPPTTGFPVRICSARVCACLFRLFQIPAAGSVNPTNAGWHVGEHCSPSAMTLTASPVRLPSPQPVQQGQRAHRCSRYLLVFFKPPWIQSGSMRPRRHISHAPIRGRGSCGGRSLNGPQRCRSHGRGRRVPVEKREGEGEEGRRAFSAPGTRGMVPRGPIGHLFGSVVRHHAQWRGLRSVPGLVCSVTVCACLFRLVQIPAAGSVNPTLAGWHVGEHRSPLSVRDDSSSRLRCVCLLPNRSSRGIPLLGANDIYTYLTGSIELFTGAQSSVHAAPSSTCRLVPGQSPPYPTRNP